MKKFFTYLLAIAAVTTVISCSKDDGPEEPDKPVQEPAITWPSNLNSDKVDITDGMEVKIDVDVPAGIKTFKIGVESKVLNENGITEIDLIGPGKAAGKSAVANGADITRSDLDLDMNTVVEMILGDGGSPEYKTSYTLDLTKLVSWINGHTTEESDHRFTVKVGDKNNKSASKTLTFHRVALPAPTITWESNPNFEQMDITDKMDVKIKIDAPAGIKTFKVSVESDALKELGITEIDLIEPDENIKSFMDLILDNAGSPKDKTEYSLDLSTLVPMINKLTTEESDHKFTVRIVDKNDQTAQKTAVFHRVAEEISGQDFTETAVSGVEFDMVFVKGGTFRMGATKEQESDALDNEKPVHSVTLSGYYIGKCEVTQGLWKAVMGSNPSRFKKGDDYPVETVSWYDIQNFLTKLNELTGKKYALPTEAQWEYAARGGAKSKSYKYSGSNTIGDVAWYGVNSEDSTHPVGKKQANELELYDMSGNVGEWCGDRYGDYSSDSQIDPTGPQTGFQVVRDCGWNVKDATFFRVSKRTNCDRNLRAGNYGFRVVLLP